ncbi:unnamed protein product [Brassica oleracea var. botrytis]|uniref:(rape) hypothetical protein n=1 Tax=Brassica napus TaxID=3708 RepID=A0A816JUL7_BRANA|nr:unnamed protein product [Brassica napus]
MEFYIGDALITQFVFRNRELSGSRRENEVSANILIRNRHKTKYSYWTEVEKIGSIDDLQQLENSVRQSLYQIRAHKIQSEIDVDFGMDNEQQLENFSWVTDENMNVPLKQEDPNMQFYHTYRDITCSASSSLESYSGIFGSPADYYVSQILEASYRPQFGGNLASSETLTANLSRYRL